MKHRQTFTRTLLSLLLAAVMLFATAISGSAADMLPGDVTGDGAISLQDYMYVRLYLLGAIDLNEQQKLCADVDGQGTVGLTDYMYIRLHVLQKIDLVQMATPEYRYSDHLYLDAKNSGNCEELTGNVLVTFIFLDTPDSTWTASDREQTLADLNNELLRLSELADGFDAELNLYYCSMDAAVTSTENIYESVAKQYGYNSASDFQLAMEQQYDVEAVPVVFLLNHGGRAYANTWDKNTVVGFEAVMLYSADVSPLCHELMHVFGADDYYYPSVVADAADLYLPESIMGASAGDVVDDLTAYAVGWLEKLSENAIAFLQAVKHLTEEDLREANAYETFTGYGTRTYRDGSVYVGDLVFGAAHGRGKLTYASGAVYEGSFENGQCSGQGKLIYVSGNVYEGNFENGLPNGYGTFTFTNGDRYAGGFKNGTFHGYGVYTFADGSAKSGYWSEGTYQG